MTARPGAARGAFPSGAVLPLALAGFAGLLGAVVAAMVGQAGGHVVYTLDDPYIHLALARELAGGHYGLHADEAAAPSSSVLWPFLLAPRARPGRRLPPARPQCRVRGRHAGRARRRVPAALVASGLGPLPSSILMKQAATSQGLLPGVAARLRDTVTHPRGVPVPPVYGPTADEGRLG